MEKYKRYTFLIIVAFLNLIGLFIFVSILGSAGSCNGGVVFGTGILFLACFNLLYLPTAILFIKKSKYAWPALISSNFIVGLLLMFGDKFALSIF